ncbi:hypothetical protein Hanom_Chr07g00668601 [Helianthus anomalus]
MKIIKQLHGIRDKEGGESYQQHEWYILQDALNRQHIFLPICYFCDPLEYLFSVLIYSA